MKITGWIFIVIATLIISCVRNSDTLTEIGNDNFSILVPGNFNQPTNIQQGSVLHLCEDTSDFLKGLSVVVYKDSKLEEGDTTDIYSYYNFVANNILDETLESGNLETPTDTVVNGYNCLLFKTCGVSNEKDSVVPVCFYTGVYEGKTFFYEVTLWCTQSNIPLYSLKIKEILSSFKEKT